MQHLKMVADELRFSPRVVCEVGVGGSKDLSQVKDFIEAGAAAILIEPLPRFYQRLVQDFAGYPQVKIFNCAVFKEDGPITLYDRDLSTFVVGIQSPSIVNDHYAPDPKDALEVMARTFDHFDDGKIDLLALDVEGCEYYVLEKMRSRPGIICLETTGMVEWGHQYVNPRIQEIAAWMGRNEYLEFGKFGADTIFLSESVWRQVRTE